YVSYLGKANTYASLNAAAYPTEALQAFGLNSVGENYYAPGSDATTLANDIYTHWNAYQSCTVWTGTVPSGSRLVASHAYSVISVNRDWSGNVTSVLLRNPWGADNTDGNPYLTVTPAEMAACQFMVDWGNV